jgi:hypothetical protein
VINSNRLNAPLALKRTRFIRLEWKISNEPDSVWTVAMYNIFDISQFGGHRNLSWVMPDERRQGKTWFRLSGAGWFGSKVKNDPSSWNGYGAIANTVRGLIMGIR